jgi:hypothetical protein
VSAPPTCDGQLNQYNLVFSSGSAMRRRSDIFPCNATPNTQPTHSAHP